MRQVDLADRLSQYQLWVQHLESGQRRVDLIELIEILRAMGLEPDTEISAILKALTNS
jgi:hypothetical protein